MISSQNLEGQSLQTVGLIFGMHKLLWSSSKFILDSAILFPFLQLSYVTETSLESTALTQWKWGESQAILVLFLVCSTILRKLQMFKDQKKKKTL